MPTKLFTYIIYALKHHGVIKYIGITKQTLRRRKQMGYKTNPDVQAIFRECEIIALEYTNDKTRENQYIEQYRKDGHPLYNKMSGCVTENRKEYLKEYSRKYNEDKRDYIREYKKRYNSENEKLREWRKAYMKEYNKMYYEKLKNQ